MGARRTTTLGVALGASAAVVLVVLSAGVSLTGPQFPSEDDLPDLPPGYSYAEPERGCGSGGCFLEVTVAPPGGLGPTEAVAELDAAVSGCRAHGFLDRRNRCTSVALRGGDTVAVAVQLRDFGK